MRSRSNCILVAFFSYIYIFFVTATQQVLKSSVSTFSPSDSYLFGNRFHWLLQSKFTNSDSVSYASSPFIIYGKGEQTLISGYDDVNVGIFVHTSEYTNRIMWTMQAKLYPPDAVARAGSIVGDNFGYSIAVVENTVVASSPNRKVKTFSNAGAAYIFNGSRNSWTLQQTLYASDPSTGDHFGISVAVNNYVLVIGAFAATNGKFGAAGCVYIFNTTLIGSGLWTQQQKLYPAETGLGNRFGEQLSLSNTSIVVSSRFNNITGEVSSGAAYVFTHNGIIWSEQQRLAPITQGSQFGWSPALGPQSLFVGSLDRTGRSSVYMFTSRNASNVGPVWSLQARLVLPAELPHLGTSLSLFNQTLVIGTDSRFSSSAATAKNFSAALVYEVVVNPLGNFTYKLVQRIGGSHGTALTTVFAMQGALVIRNGSSGLLYSTFSNKSCLQILLGDHYLDGWGDARLRVELRDYPAYFTEYAPHPDTIYPLSFRYCPSSATDIGAYQFRIRYPKQTPFIWEISYQVLEEVTGIWYHGDFSTRMVFALDRVSNAMRLVEQANALRPLACRVCSAIAVQSWLEQQEFGSDSWLEFMAYNSSFFISDTEGLTLYSYGLICSSGGKYVCIQTLKDGAYLLRSGTGFGEPRHPSNVDRLYYIAVNDSTSSWRFCGLMGSIYSELQFNITAGLCTVNYLNQTKVAASTFTWVDPL